MCASGVYAQNSQNYYWQQYQNQQSEPPPRVPPSKYGMSREQALELLELPASASPTEMKAAWVRLMQVNHPDKGGSNFFARQLNAAREVMGF